MKKANIQILLSTYNGEKYLEQQLDSILAQKGDFNIKITVRDDGSADSTPQILARYAAEHGVETILGPNLGVNASMAALAALSAPDYDYFAFCDQDDLWYDFRLNEAVTALNAANAKNNAIPTLWTCMEHLTDEHLTPYGLMPYPKYLGDFYNAAIQNKAAGHTQVFNKPLRDLYKNYPPEKMYVYDWVMYMMASAFGQVLFCEKPCGKYRQHTQNAIGYETGPLAQIPRRLKRLLRGDFKHITTQLVFFYETYKKELREDYREELNRFLAGRTNIFKRVRYALTTKIKRNSALESLQFRLLYVLGVFR